MMTLSKYYGDAHLMASAFADRPDIVQGAGGNMSVKIGAGRMLIKASGRTFGDIGKCGQNLVTVSHQKLKRYLMQEKSHRVGEGANLEIVRSCTEKSAGNERPSMEVWFHTLLPKYVLHTHSAYVNVLACSKEGRSIFGTLMKKSGLSFCTISYKNPGFELGVSVAKRLRQMSGMPAVIFLENNGIITAGDSAKRCLEIHEELEARIKEDLGITGASFTLLPLNKKETFNFKTVALFPDQVIYPEHPAIRTAHRFIFNTINESGLTVRSISDKHVFVVANMEAEKHRKSIEK